MKARLRFTCLWLSHTSRVLADACLGTLVLESIASSDRPANWIWPPVLLVVLFVLLAPLAGFRSRRLPRRGVLVAAAGFCLVIAVVFAVRAEINLVCWALAMAGSAFYYPTVQAQLPGAAREARWTLPRLDGWLVLGGGIAAVLGLATGGHWPVEKAAWIWVGLSGLCLVAAWPARFDEGEAPSPDNRPGLIPGWRRILGQRATGGVLGVMAGLRILFGAMLALLVYLLLGGNRQNLAGALPGAIQSAIWIAGGVAAGGLLASFQGNPFRTLALTAWGSVVFVVGLAVTALVGGPTLGLDLFLALMGGTVALPLAAYYQDQLLPGDRAGGTALWQVVGYSCLGLAGAGAYLLLDRGLLGPAGLLWLLVGLAVLGAVVCWRLFLREALEQLIEIGLWPFYDVKVQGPGLEEMPRRGPVIVVANHSSWFDPLWLGKVMPRPLVAMMTSMFYDRPALRWLMKNVFRAIRVQAARFRREAPELGEAIARLDQGEGLLIFPEGMMRRREDRPLRHFGQGIWHILHERPQTPVVACWIEGGWGSYASYWNGPPTVNKGRDRRRPIRIAVGPPRVLDPALLEDQRATRTYLMKLCLETRRYLGLEPLEVGAAEEGEKGEGEAT